MVPLAGAAAGAAIGAISKATAGTGITKEQLEAIRTQVTEGTSALFVVTEEGNLDRLGDRFRDTHWKLVDSNLTDAERRLLLETFGGTCRWRFGWPRSAVSSGQGCREAAPSTQQPARRGRSAPGAPQPLSDVCAGQEAVPARLLSITSRLSTAPRSSTAS
jgi:hypothetical protein